MHELLPPVLCFAVATVVQPFVIRGLRRHGVLDLPSHRSSHAVPTPRGGGIAVGLGLLAGVGIIAQRSWLPLIVAMVLFFAIGLAEDLRGLPIPVRLVLQLVTSGLVGFLLLIEAPDRPAGLALTVLAVLVAAIWITGFANAFNFMDGINGISGANAVLCGLSFMAIGKLTRHPTLIVIAAVVVAAGLAFLPWNAVRAKVFLGDVGSYTLGGVLAVLAVYSLARGVPVEAVLAPLSLYLADTGWTLVRRVARRAPWTQAHREHAYQRLCASGWLHHHVTLLTFGIGLAVCALGAVSISGNQMARVLADLLILLLLVVYLCLPHYLAGVRAASDRGRSDLVDGLPQGVRVETGRA